MSSLKWGGAFVYSWAIVFILYLPAAKAGFVADFTGWLDQEKNHTFLENLNRTNYHVHSLYQLTQFVTYIFYRLFGINEWLWHLLFITLHALNAALLYKLTTGLLEDKGVTNSKAISLAGITLFCVSPYISEVIVWEPSFHFLQGLLLVLLVLNWAQQYVRTGQPKYAIWAGIVYFLSTFSLELFYVTPWLVLTMGLFYAANTSFDKKIFSGVLRYFFAPMLLLFLVRLVVFRVVYGDWVSRIGSGAVATVQVDSFAKPVKYIFHLLFLGRFFPNDIKQGVYTLCNKGASIGIFYLVIAGIGCYIIARFRGMGGKGKVASLLFVWLMAALLLLVPLWFPDLLLVINDRYIYFASAFFYMLMAVMAGFITVSYVRVGLLALFALANLRFAILVNRYWGKSYRVIYGLLHNIPAERSKTILLLNLPQSMHGVAMIGAEKDSEYKLMHDLLLPEQAIKTTVYDVQAYNMETPTDGAHVKVLNDNTLQVTLNQWGTWWWFETQGGHSYENKDFKLNMIDGGHFYELTLKKPAEQYLLLYEVGDQWKQVDWGKKGVEQD